jgi:ATP-binding cassette subfamily B multidrug efflux pump
MILWKFVRAYGLRYLHWYALGALALAATNALSVTIPLYLAQGIDALALGEAGRDIVTRSIVLVMGMGVAVIGIRTASRVLFFNPGRMVEAELLHDLFAAMLRQQPDFFAKLSAGDLTSRLTTDAQTVRLLFGFTALGLFNTIAAAVFAGLRLIELSPWLGLLAGLPLALAFAASSAAVSRMRDFMRENQELLATLSEQTLASLQGIAAVHAFGAAPALVRRFELTNRAIERNQVSRAGLRVAIGPLLGLAAAIDGFLILWMGGPRALLGELTTGEIIAFLAIVAYLAAPLRSFTFTLAVIRQSGVSLERVDAVLSAVPMRPDLPSPLPSPFAQARPARPPTLTARDLSYRYPGSDRDALSGVSFEVPAGRVLGVFGATGSGKSTLVRCLLRLCDPPPGTLFADGLDVRQLDLDTWREHVVLVPQRAFLWSGTVRENILLGRTDLDLHSLIDEAQLRVDVDALPQGVDTVVGEAGITLSGGQRQRVALARGLARDASVLVLDDVLSAVDHTTEAALAQALERRANGPTTVIVSNRISALRHAHTIVVLAGGRMIDQGTHPELMSRPGPYREAALRQSEDTRG